MATTTKTVKVEARITFKDPARAGYVLYVVRSSDGTNLYRTTLLNGRAVGCTCPAGKPCYHMVQLEAYEVTFTAQIADAEARLAETKVQEQTANERSIFAVNMAAFIDAVVSEAARQRRDSAPLTNNTGFQFMMPEHPIEARRRKQPVASVADIVAYRAYHAPVSARVQENW